MTDKTIDLILDDRPVTLEIQRSPRSKRIRLRIDRIKRHAVLVLTKRASEKSGIDFVYRNAAWILGQLEALPERKVFSDGLHFSLLGEEVSIHHSPTAKRGVWLEEGILWVSGASEHLARRATDFIKEQARSYAKTKAMEFGKKLGVTPGKITIRDTKSRWGSCNKNGDISLSWRLALAPTKIFDYVIVHEAAHVRHMNHSPHFWKTVEEVIPEYKQAERWLKKKSAYLYSF